MRISRWLLAIAIFLGACGNDKSPENSNDNLASWHSPIAAHRLAALDQGDGEVPMEIVKEWEVVMDSLHEKSGVSKDDIEATLKWHWTFDNQFLDNASTKFEKMIAFTNAVDSSFTKETFNTRFDEKESVRFSQTTGTSFVALWTQSEGRIDVLKEMINGVIPLTQAEIERMEAGKN